MDAKQFFRLIEKLRNKQKEYFQTRTQTALKESKQLEKAVDDEIDRVNKILNNKTQGTIKF